MQYLVPDNVYNVLKWAGLIACPAIATLVGTIGNAAGWEWTALAVTVITAVGTFIGSLLGVSEKTKKAA